MEGGFANLVFWGRLGLGEDVAWLADEALVDRVAIDRAVALVWRLYK